MVLAIKEVQKQLKLDHVLIDMKLELDIPSTSIIKGDANIIVSQQPVL